LADVTLIDSQFRSINASFGMVFQYAEKHGVDPIDIMPLGRPRNEFQAAYNERLAATTHDELCDRLARQYVQEFPGMFTAR